MNSRWFDFHEDLSSDFFNRPSRLSLIKKKFGLSASKSEEQALKSWGSLNEVNNFLDYATSRTGIFGKSKFWESVLKDDLIDRESFTCDSPVRISEIDSDDLFSDFNAKARRLRNRIEKERFDSDADGKKRETKWRRDSRSSGPEKSNSCGSANSSFNFTDVTNDLNKSGSRKSSFQGNVTFPTSSSSNVSESSVSFSEKSNASDESVCTEKSANCSSVSEKLSDGTNKTKIENNETWRRKSPGGSRVAEKQVKDWTVTEQKDNKLNEKSSKRTSYLEKSATGTSLQEESTSERVVSCDEGGVKTVEQKTSSETYKKGFRSTPNKSTFYDELDSCSFQHYVPPSLTRSSHDDDVDKTPVLRRKDFGRSSRGRTVSEKISKLIDEAVEQDNFFRISTLQADIDKIADDFFGRRASERRRDSRTRSSGRFLGAGKSDQDLTWSKFNELKTENESLQEENSKLQSIIQDVTSVNKRWQKYNNERRLYVQKLLSTIQGQQEQINSINERAAYQPTSREGSDADVERLKKEHQEHITVLELQIKSHKDDWDAERKEKRKAVQEKEELEETVKELTREVRFLKNLLQEERNRKPTSCATCRGDADQNSIFSQPDFFPPGGPLRVSRTFLPKTFRTSVHVPYSPTDLSSDGCFFSDDELAKDVQQSCSEFSEVDQTYSSERFSRNTQFTQDKKTAPGDTIVVEDESGIRLSITEQHPSKDSRLKSILKKNDKKLRLSSKSFSGQSDLKDRGSTSYRKPPMDKPNITCEEFESHDSDRGLSIGFQDGGLARITSFSPDSVAASDSSFQYLSPGSTTGMENRSKSEPNTRSNSSENLKPLRESSSWENECSGVDTDTRENVVCPSCDRVFPPSMHLQFLDHFEICPGENNHF